VEAGPFPIKDITFSLILLVSRFENQPDILIIKIFQG
jgi:hypothetical protein